MKKILLLLIFIIVGVFFGANVARAVGCGSGNVESPTLVEVNSDITCTSPSDSFEGYYYYFYLNSRQEVHFTVTNQPVNWQVAFAFAKKDEWSSKLVPASGSKNIRTGLWGDEKWTIDAGYWEILVLPNPTSQSDDFSGSFQGISSFSLNITTAQGPATYCGDGSCNGEETCSFCSSDCGDCAQSKKSDGESCSANTECQSGNCNHLGIWQNTGWCCAADQRCCESPSDTITVVYDIDYKCGSGYFLVEQKNSKKSDGFSCALASECQGGFCVHEVCRSSSTHCGDNYCDFGEFCSDCSSDCGSCGGTYCGDGFCNPWEDCFICQKDCPVCPTKKYGETCSTDKECLSDYCHSTERICCNASAWGCCRQASECGDESRFVCENFTCISQQKAEEPVEKPSEAEEPVEKPSEAEEPISSAPTAIPQEGVIVIFVSNASLKKGETQEPLIIIQNKGQKEVILGEYILVENSIPAAVDTETSALQLFKKKLLPGEEISTEISLTGLKQGSGAIKLKMVYFVDNQVKWAEDELSVSVSDIHIQKEETASQVFNETMLLEEKREVKDEVLATKEEYVFVSVEDKSLQQAAINDWETNHKKREKVVASLKDDFTGVVKPEVLSFFETIKSLEEAKSYQEVTEASVRALAPPAIVAGFDFANLLDAIEKQKKLERGLLAHFGATDFGKVPIYDEEGNVTGYTKAIIKEKDGKFYAVKIGDL